MRKSRTRRSGVVLFATVVSTALGRTLKNMHTLASRTPLPGWFRPAVGALVGVIGLFLPLVLGEGYLSVQQMIDGIFPPGLLSKATLLDHYRKELIVQTGF